MRKTINKIAGWRDAIDRRLHSRLEALSPKARLTAVVVIFSLFTAGCLVMLGTAIRDFGKGSEPMRIEHIEHLELPSLERPDCETPEHDADETE